MKNIVILILFFSFLNAEINEHKTDLYFANGIATVEKDAIKTWHSLHNKLIENNTNIKWSINNYKIKFKNNKYTKYITSVEDYHLAYNHTVGVIGDVTESLYQKFDLNQLALLQKLPYTELHEAFKLFPQYAKVAEGVETVSSILGPLGIMWMMQDIKMKIKNDFPEAIESTNDIFNKETDTSDFTEYQAKVFEKFIDGKLTITDVINLAGDFPELYSLGDFKAVNQKLEEIDLSKQEEGYKDYINSTGHKIFVVSHSQGNLYTEKIYKNLQKDWYKDFFDAYGIASPSATILGKSTASTDDYITHINDPILLIPGGLNSNSHNVCPQSDDIGGAYAHFIKTYLGSSCMMNVITMAIDKKLRAKEKLTQWGILEIIPPEDINSTEENLTDCSLKTFVNAHTGETLEGIPFSTNYHNTLLTTIKDKNGTEFIIKSIYKGAEIEKYENANLEEIPNPKPNNFCYYLHYAHEFSDGFIEDNRDFDLKKIDEESFYEILTISFNRIEDVYVYVLHFTDNQGVEHSEEVRINNQNDFFIENNQVKVKYKYIFKKPGQYVNIYLQRNDTGDMSQSIEYEALSSVMDRSLFSEQLDEDTIKLSWNYQSSIEHLKLFVQNEDNKTLYENDKLFIEQDFIFNNSMIPEEKKDLITRTYHFVLEKKNKVRTILAHNSLTLDKITSKVLSPPAFLLIQDRYDQKKDYIRIRFYTHLSKYPDAKKMEVMVDYKPIFTLLKSDFTSGSTSNIIEISWKEEGFLFKPHTIQLVPYNKYNERGIPSVLQNIPMNLLTLNPKVANPAGKFIEDRYYSDNDELTFSWFTGKGRYPDISKLEILINGSIYKTLNRSEMTGGYYDIDKYVQFGISKNTSQSITLKGYDKFGNLGDTKTVNVNMSGIDTTPKINYQLLKSDSVNYVNIPASINSYRNAFYVEVFLNNNLENTFDLDRLKEGGNEKVYVDNNQSWELKVIAYNKYDEPSIPAILKRKE